MNGRRSRLARRSIALALTAKPAAVGIAIATPRIASAATLPVGCTEQALRDAVIQANAATTTTLSLTPGCTYTLTGADPTSTGDGLAVITKDVTVQGNGATITRGAAAANFRLFEVSSTGTLAMDHVTLSNGFTTSGGGAILNAGTLSLTSATVTGNTASATSGSIAAKGGGILADPGATTTITDSTISGNVATMPGSNGQGSTAVGGGIAAKGGTLRVRNSSITGNSATAAETAANATATASGGGISANVGVSPGTPPDLTVTITGSTLSGNSATATSSTGSSSSRGGAVVVQNYGQGVTPPVDNVTLTNSTIAGNSVTSGTAAANTGSALELQSLATGTDTLTVVNSTVSGNTGARGSVQHGATGGTGPAGGTLTLTNTILASNPGGNCDGTIGDGGKNISFPATDTSCVNTFAQGDPKLGPLQNNGGLTKTMALGTGSLAIDQGKEATCVAAQPAGAGSIDQRGLPRVDVAADTLCDIGAFEVQAAVVVPSPSPSPTQSVKPTLPKAGASVPAPSGLPWPLIVPAAVASAGALAGAARRARRRADR